MRRIAWTIEARQEVRSYLSWLRARNRLAALRAELDILDLVASAAKRPNLGRVDELQQVSFRGFTQ
jgi:plasmid stabilization system protein ParE